MNILLINPNTSAHITAMMTAVAQATVKDQARVTGVTAARGPAVVGSRVENTLAASAAVELGAATMNRSMRYCSAYRLTPALLHFGSF